MSILSLFEIIFWIGKALAHGSKLVLLESCQQCKGKDGDDPTTDLNEGEPESAPIPILVEEEKGYIASKQDSLVAEEEMIEIADV